MASEHMGGDGRIDAEIYLTEVLDGTVVACKAIRQMAAMMLPRISAGYKRWHFDVARATKPVRFIERYCHLVEGEKRGQPFKLERFQKAAIELAYGFVDDDGVRQFQTAFMEIGRKNGKTALMSALCLYHLMADGEPGAEVYNCATSEAQARKCYGSADQMREISPALKKRLRRGMAQKTGRSAINYDANGSMLCALAANPKRKDGLSASAIIYDELAAVEDNGALYDVLEESMAARRQPMIWVISSENYIRDGIWDDKIRYCKGVLDGSVDDDTVLPLLYTLDSRAELLDEDAWAKANPGLGTIKDVEKLRQKVKRAQASTRSLPSLLTKEFCLRAGAYTSYIDYDDCVNETPMDFAKLGMPSYVMVGFDLARVEDLCACVVRWRRPADDNIYELAKFWVPSEALGMDTDGQQKDHVPYLQWSSQGQPMGGRTWAWVDVVEGDRIDQMVIIDFLRELVEEGIYPFAIAYDPWRVDDYTDRELHRLVGDSRVLPITQSGRVISPLMKEHRLDLKAHRVICPNPCLHHNRGNVQARTDNNDNDFPQKKDLDRAHKIDGFMAELFALAAEKKFYEEYMSAIEY